MSGSLGEYLLDRTESLGDDLILKYFIENNDDKVSRLLDSEQYLLEGSRGIGKTMLMKHAMLKSAVNFGSNSILPVWISFEESLRIERIMVVGGSVDPFLQWTMGKILSETIKKILELKPGCLRDLDNRLSIIFGTSLVDDTKKYHELLSDYVVALERADINSSEDIKGMVGSAKLVATLDNPQSFKSFLLELISDFQLSRIVFLFDEAAHVFSHSQQEKFFTFFKSLRNPKISCKAAVYPGITNYGKFFERGQDAKELSMSWSPKDDGDVGYIKKILKKRIQEFDEKYWNKLTVNPDVIDTICVCSNGNPRFSFHIIDGLEDKKGFDGSNISQQLIINTIREVFNTKWKEFETLKKRLVKYAVHIGEAELFVKNTLIPNIRAWNVKQRESGRKLSAGVFVSTDAFSSLEKVFSILNYSNIVNIDHSKKSIGHGRYGYYIAINPSLLFSDLILKNIDEFRMTSVAIENNQAYYETTPSIKDVVSRLDESSEYDCSNTLCDFRTVDESYMFCPKCGGGIEKNECESLYKILRSHDIYSLSISNKIALRIGEKFENIGQVYDSDVDEIRMKYIQDVRARNVKNAAIEYMAG